MQAVPDTFESDTDRAEFFGVAHRPGVELYRAHIVRHAFESHAHEGFGLGVIESGVERFRCAGSEHLAAPQSIVTMNPDVLHTGQAATEGGWRYRMLYLEPGLVEQITGERGWHFPDPVAAHDARRARRLLALHAQLWQAREPLEFDSLLAQVTRELRPLARVARASADGAAARFAPVLDYIEANLHASLRLDELARVAGLSPFHFLRKFQAQFHVTPHQMVMARRLLAAKRLLARRVPAAEVAAATGLTDQAHLTRAFARRYGVTPARYQRQVNA